MHPLTHPPTHRFLDSNRDRPHVRSVSCPSRGQSRFGRVPGHVRRRQGTVEAISGEGGFGTGRDWASPKPMSSPHSLYGLGRGHSLRTHRTRPLASPANPPRPQTASVRSPGPNYAPEGRSLGRGTHDPRAGTKAHRKLWGTWSGRRTYKLATGNTSGGRDHRRPGHHTVQVSGPDLLPRTYRGSTKCKRSVPASLQSLWSLVCLVQRFRTKQTRKGGQNAPMVL